MRHKCTVFVVLFFIITAAKANEFGGSRRTTPLDGKTRTPAGQQIINGYDNASVARELDSLRNFCNGHSMADETYSCYCETPREYDFGPDEGKVRLCEKFYTWNEVLDKARDFRRNSSPQSPRICNPKVVTCKSIGGCITREGKTVARGTQIGLCI